MEENMETVFYTIMGLVTLIYAFFEYRFSYWARRGVPYVEPKIPFGNMKGTARHLHSSQLLKQYYEQFKGKHPFVGIYMFTTPCALILDLDLVKSVLIRDFKYFNDRGAFYNEKDDPLSAHLFSLEGEKWKILRSKLTPTFTSGRMKFMFPTIVEVGDRFREALREIVTNQNEIELKDILARFTTDVIGSCAFGIQCNSLKEQDDRFVKMGQKAFVPRYGRTKRMLIYTFRKLAAKLGFKLNHDDVIQFFMDIVRETVEFRENSDAHRKDFMHLLMQLKKSGKLEGAAESDETGFLSLQEIAAQAFVFFVAGLETSSTNLSFCLYELALNHACQDKAREEINDVLRKYEGKFTYEAMMEMTYINQIINETLRKYPPATIIRMATKDYPVPNTNSIIERGNFVWIPTYAIHHDPDIYPDPEVFNPERFTPEAVKARHPQSFLSFGDGPRNCIGLRFGLMQVRVGLVTALTHFRFKTCSKTTIPMTVCPKSFALSLKGGFWLHVEPL